ncbi:hypothetical protein HRQ91_03710 [Treponema parvum]|uniref:Lipoprotein n=1 Tax=Treponema parvum TaxID=138851 RepID=A0A975IEU0_9SPIR|nr:hypothetical protein [Treponema parvum]QTQ13634.1 hypothetical protein HRQ91_03710 [Treponema parvum]
MINKKLPLYLLFFSTCFCSVFFSSCADSGVSNIVDSEKLFVLEYGKFDNQIDLFNISSVGPMSTFISMKDGFFYISNGESKKIMEMNSYGDLLTLFYNEETNVRPDFVLSTDTVDSTKKAVSYPFNFPGVITVDSRKCIYVVDSLPQEQQILNTDENLVYRQVVLRFASNGKALDYIGRQGVGGTPFPYIKSIYITRQDELVVVCVTNTGLIVYWFNSSGQLLYVVPINNSDLPNPFTENSTEDYYMTAGNIIPAPDKDILYIKIDYFLTHFDQDSKVQSGIDYTNTLLYPINASTGLYSEPLKIPAYEETVSDGFGKVVYTTPYEFIGVTDSGWMFFSLPVNDGYMLQIIQPGGHRVLNRKIKVDSARLLYYTFSLSQTGILSGLFAYPENAAIEWWRIDSLIENLSEG